MFIVFENSCAIIKMDNKFNFERHIEFKNITENILEKPIKTIQVDFSECSYLDSSGLGMLLILREKVKDKGIVLQLTNILKDQAIDQIIKIASFEKLFEIKRI